MTKLVSLLCVLLALHSALSGEVPVENFATLAPPWSGSWAKCEAIEAPSPVGAYCGRIVFDFSNRNITSARIYPRLNLPEGSRKVSFYLKSDGLSYRLTFFFHLFTRRSDGRIVRKKWNFISHSIQTNFKEWKKFTFELGELSPPDIPQFGEIRLERPRPRKDEKPPERSTLYIDDITAFVPQEKSPLHISVETVGGATFELTHRVRLLADVRVETRAPQKVKLTISVFDSNQQTIQEEKAELTISRSEPFEGIYVLSDKAQSALSPFTVTLRAFAPGLKTIKTVSTQFSAGNARIPIESFEEVKGIWDIVENPYGIPRGDVYRPGSPFVHMSIERTSERVHSGKYAGKLSYNFPSRREARLCSSLRYMRDFPGRPYKMGFWLYGDNSGIDLSVSFIDWGNRRWNLTYYRHTDTWTIPLGRIDWDGWKYIELLLPGRGIGQKGTDEGKRGVVDFPLRLISINFRNYDREPKSGTLYIDDLSIFDQKPNTGFLFLDLACSNDDNILEPDTRLYIYSHNTDLLRPRKVSLYWELVDDADRSRLLHSRTSFTLDPDSVKVEEINLREIYSKRDQIRGCLVLTAELQDTENIDDTATASIALTYPNCRVPYYDFETQETFLSMADASFSTARAHSGKSSIELRYRRPEKPSRHPRTYGLKFVEPPPGIPYKIGVWLYGDSSRTGFYLLFDDRGPAPLRGVYNDSFFSEGVRIDWNGWKYLELSCPKTFPGWQKKNDIFLPNYPLGCSPKVEVNASVSRAEGSLFVDDLSVITHLPFAESILIRLKKTNVLSIFKPGSTLTLELINTNLEFPRRISFVATLETLGGAVLARSSPLQTTLKPQQKVPVSLKPPPGTKGFFTINYTLDFPTRPHLKRTGAFEVVLYDFGFKDDAELISAFSDTTCLRKLLRAPEVVEVMEWDSMEILKGLFYPYWFDLKLRKALKDGLMVYAILGYGADWAGGVGYQSFKEGKYSRWIGSNMQPPEDIRDWDYYTLLCARRYRKKINHWMVWNVPDSSGILGCPPEKYVQMLRSAYQNLKRYNPTAEVILGSLSSETGLPYLRELLRKGAGGYFDTIGARLDMGSLPPEYGFLLEFVSSLKALLVEAKANARILITYMDWLAGEDPELGYHRQACYISRGLVLTKLAGVYRPLLNLAHSEFKRKGTGLIYKRELAITGNTPYAYPKPAFVSYLVTRKWLDNASLVKEVELLDKEPFYTRCCLFRAGRAAFAVLWRIEGIATASLPPSLKPLSVFDAYGVEYPAKNVLPVSELPLFVTFRAEELPRWLDQLPSATIRYKPTAGSEWRQRLLDSLIPSDTQNLKAHNYSSEGKTATRSARLVSGFLTERTGIYPCKNESFTIHLRSYKGGDLVLFKRSFIDATQKFTLSIDGKEFLTIDSSSSEEPRLLGFRDIPIIIDRSLVAGKNSIKIDVTYERGGSSFGYWLYENSSRRYYLSDLSPISALQGWGTFKRDLNVFSRPITITKQSFEKGIGTHSPSRIEFLLNGQFKTFSSVIGIDSVTRGKGSVIFLVFADGKQKYKSDVITGFSLPTKIGVDVRGVKRLLLAVEDADDGNDYDFAVWANPLLTR